MTRLIGCSLLVGVLTGCSTHPCADISDYLCPGKFGRNQVTPYGGVNIAQSLIGVPGTSLPIMGSPVPLTPGALVIPPPVPLPGVRPPGDFQLQPPLPGGIPPLPPPPPKNF